MKVFFARMYYFCNVALVVLLVAGCATPSAPSAQEGMSPPAAEASANEQQPDDGSTHDIVTARSEAKLLYQRLEEIQKLLDDLARYPNLSVEEMRLTQTELSNNISAANPNNGNRSRIRLAYLLSLQPGGTNDQRAISLLDAVAKNEKTWTSLRHLASVLRSQIQEKQRALQKLEALRDVDRRLLDEQMAGGKTPMPKTISKKTTPKAAPK